MNRIIFGIMVFLAASGLLSSTLSAQPGNLSTTHAVTMSVQGASVISLNNTEPIELVIKVPSTGGMDITGSSDSTKRLQYTTIAERGMTKRITVLLNTGGETPSGTFLSLKATGVPADCGTSAGQIRLSEDPQDLITDIRSGRTGEEGVTLEYNFGIDSLESLVIGETQTVAVTFTITDA